MKRWKKRKTLVHCKLPAASVLRPLSGTSGPEDRTIVSLINITTAKAVDNSSHSPMYLFIFAKVMQKFFFVTDRQRKRTWLHAMPSALYLFYLKYYIKTFSLNLWLLREKLSATWQWVKSGPESGCFSCASCPTLKGSASLNRTQS